MKLSKTLLIACAVLVNAGACANDLPPITPVPHVDLPRFMGDWYVIATIPTRFEKDACNALEVYTLKANGDIATSFHFRAGSFAGKAREIHSTGIVKGGTGNAVWAVQVFWPLKARCSFWKNCRRRLSTSIARLAQLAQRSIALSKC